VPTLSEICRPLFPCPLVPTLQRQNKKTRAGTREKKKLRVYLPCCIYAFPVPLHEEQLIVRYPDPPHARQLWFLSLFPEPKHVAQTSKALPVPAQAEHLSFPCVLPVLVLFMESLLAQRALCIYT